MDNLNQHPAKMRPGLSGRPPQMPRPPMPPAAGGMAMTPKEILGILRRHIWMILIFTVLGTIIGGGAWFLCDRYLPRYTSIRTIDVDMPVTQDPLKLATSQVAKDIYYNFRFTKASLVKQQNMLEELLRRSKVRDTQWFKRHAKVDAQGRLIGDQDKAVNKAYKDLDENLRASAPRDQNYIIVSMSCANPREAKLIVDEMVDIFLAQQRDLAQSQFKSELAQLTSQRDELQSTLNQIESELNAIRSGTSFARLNLGENQSFRDYMDEKLSDLEKQYTDLSSRKSGLQTQIEILKKRATEQDFDKRVQEQAQSDPTAHFIRDRIAALEPELERQRIRFGEDHRIVRDTQAVLDQLRDAYDKRRREIGDIIRQSNWMEAEEAMASLAQEFETTQKQLQAARDEYKAIDQVRSRYAVVERKRIETRSLLEEMNAAIEKKKAQIDDPKLSKLSSTYTATLPREKSFPRKIVFFPGGFILGMLAGLGLAFLIEFMNDLLRTPSDVMRYLKVPLLGMISHADDDDDIEGVDLYHVVRQAPYSMMSECYRQLRINLKLSGSGNANKKTLLVTSGQAEDGKTTVAVNLASALLAEGRRVLLIDTNFRRPAANRLFPPSQPNGAPAESGYGLSNYLMGQCDNAAQIIREAEIAGLYIIDCGPLPANPAELLSGKNMKDLLGYAKSNFDYVILDGPATLVSDSKALAVQVDGTLIVFNAERTHRGQALRILREMREIHANVIGAVLLGVKSRKGGYFRENYRSYQDYQKVQVEQLV